MYYDILVENLDTSIQVKVNEINSVRNLDVLLLSFPVDILMN